MKDYLAKLPNYSNGVWASEGARSQPTLDKINQGHIVEKPPFQMVNWLENRQDNAIYYLLQNGLTQWNLGMYYPANAITCVGKEVYISKEPTIGQKPSESDKWELLFFTKKDGDDLKDLVNKIKNEDGFLDHYMRKSKPVATGVIKGVGYGFSEPSDQEDGLFHDTGSPIMKNDGVVVAKFEKVESLLEVSKRVVTMDVLQEALKKQQAFKVGSIYITTTRNNPADELGYGEWESYAHGCVLVGLSTYGDHPNWTRTMESQYGEFEHQLTVDEMPNHTHEGKSYRSLSYAGDSGRNGGGAVDDGWNMSIGSSGGNKSHNNVQPSIVVAIWRRIK